MIEKTAVLLTICTVSMVALAQSSSLSMSIGVHVFPREGQDATQQSIDESDCYTWAVDRTQTDPFELARHANEQKAAADQAMAEAQSAGQGSAGRSAAGGAVAGALIGGIFGRGPRSAGRGAAIGATTGAIAGSSQGNQAQAQATQQVASQAAQTKAATEGQMNSFRTAFITCLEAKDYIAKF